jgi:hypothetical protein
MNLFPHQHLSNKAYYYEMSRVNELGQNGAWRGCTQSYEESLAMVLNLLSCVMLQPLDYSDVYDKSDADWDDLLASAKISMMVVLNDWLQPEQRWRETPDLQTIGCALFGQAWWELVVPDSARTDVNALSACICSGRPEFVPGLVTAETIPVPRILPDIS